MITIRNTENLTGVTIRGDYDDLYELVDAFHEIAIDEYSEKHHEYIDMSTRLLGLYYDIRHAYQGDREIALVDNGMDRDKMNWHSTITPEKNVYYECNYLYPEMFFAVMAINELIGVRIKVLTKKNQTYYDSYVDKKVIWDKTITALRSFQSAFSECVKETLTPNQYSRWLKAITRPYISICRMVGQYLDVLNMDYTDMSKEKRLKSLTSITKRISDYWLDDEYREIERGVSQAAKEYGCEKSDIKLGSVDYPDEIEW